MDGEASIMLKAAVFLWKDLLRELLYFCSKIAFTYVFLQQ